MESEDQTIIDLGNGQKIPLEGNFDTGPIGFFEAFEMFKGEFLRSEFGQSLQAAVPESLKLFAQRVNDGDVVSVCIAGATLGLGILVIMNMFGSSGGSGCPAGYGSGNGSSSKVEEEEEKEPPRDFTIEQLREFDGIDGKPIYISLRGDVYDCSAASDFYGEGSGYHCFAGREASRAMAKLSFEEEELSNTNLDDLGPFERSTLEDWVVKFKHYKSYPVVGRVQINLPASKEFKRSELAPFKGTQEVPAGRVDAPIYVGIKGKVVDVSFGGKEFYGPGETYHIFAGIDASRALAKMSFNEEDLKNSSIDDLTPEQLKVLDDWEKKFITTKKYPVVGTIVE
jgi:membrane-associated progesterone receptor component